MNPSGPRPAQPLVFGNASHLPSSLFRKFSRHMPPWSKPHSTNQDHVMHSLNSADAIIAAASSLQPVQDAVEQQLADELHRNLASKMAQHNWGHHRATKSIRRPQRHLRRFGQCAVRGHSTFINALKWSLITPFRTTSPQPDTASPHETSSARRGGPTMEPRRGQGSSITSLKTRTASKPRSSLLAIFHKSAT